jgi:DNA-binding response OmpR family regulator
VARRVVLLITAEHEDAWQTVVRNAGYLPLLAPTVSRALFLLNKVRPAVILLDAQVVGPEPFNAIHELRLAPAAETVPLVVLGTLGREQQAAATHEPQVLVRQVDSAGGILAVLEEVVGGPRPTPYR